MGLERSEALSGFPSKLGSGARPLSGLCTPGGVAAECPQPPPTPGSQSPCLRAILRLPRPPSALPPAGPAWGGRCHPPSLPLPSPLLLVLISCSCRPGLGNSRGWGDWREGSCLVLEDKATSSSVSIPLGHPGTCNSYDTDGKSEAAQKELTGGLAESQD